MKGVAQRGWRRGHLPTNKDEGEHGIFNSRAPTMIRYCLIALMLCLSGCDEPKDAVPLAPAPPVEVPDVAEVPAAVTSPDAPVPASAPVGVPAQPESAPLPAPVVKAQAPRPKSAASKPASKSSAKSQKLAPLPLDLSLPHDLVDQLEHGEPIPEIVPKPRLLPPLFGERPAEPSAFQLSGKLITNDLDREKLESDNLLDKVEGAQLNFEFRK